MQEMLPVDRLKESSIWTWATLAGYLSIVLFTVSRHEPWADEAQAWLLARGAAPWELLAHILRYEGHPGLWHLLLMVPAKLSLPYPVIGIISATIASVGVFVLVRYAPFPLPVRVLLPFTFFLVYQYSVVARSYVLFPVLLFLLAVVYPKAHLHPFAFTVLLCLLANVSVHGVLIGVSIFVLCLWQTRAKWSGMETALKRKHYIAWTVYGVVLIAVFLQLLPPPDPFVTGYETDIQTILRRAGSVLYRPFADQVWLSLIVVAVSIWWFWRNDALLVWLLPTGLVIAFSAVIYVNFWHQGIVFLIWVFAMWIAAPKAGRTQPLVLAVWGIVLAVQLFWAWESIRCDIRGVYSSGKDVSSFIREQRLETSRIYAFGFPCVSILPYFKRNIFDNLNPATGRAYWIWSTSNRANEQLSQIPKALPDVIIFAIKWPNQERMSRELIPRLKLYGYSSARRFSGAICWKGAIAEPDTFDVLIRAAGSGEPQTPDAEPWPAAWPQTPGN